VSTVHFKKKEERWTDVKKQQQEEKWTFITQRPKHKFSNLG
jgi:hypothetical protein